MLRLLTLCIGLFALGCAVAAKAPLPSDLDIEVQADSAADGMGPFQGEIDLCGGTSEDGLTEQNGLHFYHFESDGCNDARLELRSFEGQDTLLILFEPFVGDWLELGRNDDCDGSQTESCIRRALPVGDYIVGVTTYGRFTSGVDVATEYELSVSCMDEFSCGFADCMNDDECGAGRFCAYDRSASCGESGPGACQVYADVCSPDFAEVCGCDENTYANECTAQARGISVASDTACGVGGDGAEGDQCEGREFPGCRPGLRCDFSGLSSCAVAAPGVCGRDDAVLCPDVLDPVCGCDGRTYGNSCLRRAAGVAEDHDGDC
jgi:hypothetical protein